jgi:hypothetical protein
MNKHNLEIPDWKLERYLLNELPEADMKYVRTAVETDPAVRSRLTNLEESNRAILGQYPPDRVADTIMERSRKSRVETRRRAPQFRVLPDLAALVLAMGAAMLLIYVSLPYFRGSTAAVSQTQRMETDTRIKGLSPRLFLYRKTRVGSEPLPNEGLARQGDLVQLAYRPAGKPFGVILSIDGRGTVTLHMPRQGGNSAHLKRGDVIPLDASYLLDDAPNWERFYFITSDAAFDTEPILKAAGSAAAGRSTLAPGKMNLPTTFDQYSITIRKGD